VKLAALSVASAQALLLAGLCAFSSPAFAADAASASAAGGATADKTAGKPAAADAAPSLSATAKAVETAIPLPRATNEARRIVPPFDVDAFKKQLRGDLEGALKDELSRQFRKEINVKIDEDLKLEAQRLASKGAEDTADLRSRIDSLRLRIEQNEKDLADSQRQRAGLEVQLKEALDAQGRQADQIKGLSEKAGKAEKDLGLGLKRVEDLADSLESKGEKMTGLLDIVGTLKRDLRDLNADMVEMKGDLKAMQAKGNEDDNTSWWAKASRWPYLPAVAAGLSALALGMAIAK